VLDILEKFQALSGLSACTPGITLREAIRTVPATALAAIPTFQMVFLGEDQQTVGGEVVFLLRGRK
jgi:hypothetical protein